VATFHYWQMCTIVNFGSFLKKNVVISNYDQFSIVSYVLSINIDVVLTFYHEVIYSYEVV